MDATKQLSAHDQRRLAVSAAVDPRTVRKWLRGEPVVSTCAARLTDAFSKLFPQVEIPDSAPGGEVTQGAMAWQMK